MDPTRLPSTTHAELIYINDIANSTTEKVLSFADDTPLYISDSKTEYTLITQILK